VLLKLQKKKHIIPCQVLEPGESKPATYQMNVRSNTTDILMVKDVLITREYSFNFRKDPQVIIDAGANIGATSVYFAEKFPQATIIAIEPDHENFQLLQKNITSYQNIYPIEGALWYVDSKLSLSNPLNAECAYRVGENESSSSNTAIDAYSIESICQQFNLDHIDLLKLDIEGAEKELFSNSPEKWLPRVNCIIIELHDRYKVGCSRAFYNAIQDFPEEAINGENICVAKTNWLN
jgi:FkbM family methyltransferase